MSTVTYKVTQRIIDEGQRGRCGSCPVALALLASGLIDVSAGGIYAVATGSCGHRMRAQLPVEVSAFMADFDRGLAVQPLSFTLTWDLVEGLAS